MTPKNVVLIFIILNLNFESNSAEEYTMAVTGSSQNRIRGYFDSFTNLLEKFNDKHLGNSEIGKLIRYNELKHKIDGVPRAANLKRLSLAVIPLIFHMGATSIWVMLTSLMAAKSVAIGLALLVFKIAVSSAKVASFFTALKVKGQQPLWAWAPHSPPLPPPSPPHFDHYDHAGFYERSFSGPYHGWKGAPVYDHQVQEHPTHLVQPHHHQDPYGLDIRGS